MRRSCRFFLFFMISFSAFHGGHVRGEWESVSSETFLEEDIPGKDDVVTSEKTSAVVKQQVDSVPQIEVMEETTVEASEVEERKSPSDIKSCSFIEVVGGTCLGLNMGWNCRFQKTAFVMGVIFGGAFALHRPAHVISYDTSGDANISDFLTLGYFDGAFRFGVAFARVLPFVKFGWCVDRYSLDIKTDDDEIVLGKSWFNGFLYGVGCDLNLSQSLSIGLAIDLHAAYGHTLDFFVKDDTSIYKPYSMQYFVTLKYQMTK